MGRPPAIEPRDSIASLRLTLTEREEIKQTSRALGFKNISDYIRHLHRESAKKLGSAVRAHADRDEGYGQLQEELRTDYGKILHGNSLAYLLKRAQPESVNLIVTSPPFGLIRKKSYGNEDADAYCEWFRPFAKGFHRALKADGSLVIDIGGAWKPGQRGCAEFCVNGQSTAGASLLVLLHNEYQEARSPRRIAGQPAGRLQEA